MEWDTSHRDAFNSDKMLTNPATPTVSSHNGSPNSVICLRQVNDHRCLVHSLNVSVTLGSALTNNC